MMPRPKYSFWAAYTSNQPCCLASCIVSLHLFPALVVSDLTVGGTKINFQSDQALGLGVQIKAYGFLRLIRRGCM